jgi:hypothetical protein
LDDQRNVSGDREIMARLKVQQIDEVQLLGAVRNDDAEGLIGSFCTADE